MGKYLAAVVLITVIIISSSVPAFARLAEFRSARRYATQNGRMFNFETWDAKLIWHATFFSEKLRNAYINKTIVLKHMNEEEALFFREDEERRQTRGWDFFIGTYTKKDYKKFSSDTDTFWKIRLTTESGEEVEPESIESIAITPYEKIIFPYLTRWSKAYRVTFPKVEIGSRFSLTMMSVVGESKLNWKFQ